jgi:hypothetical protein
MAKVKIQGHASGTGVITVTAPNTSTDRTITLPDGTGTLALTTGDDDKLPLAGGTLTGNLSITNSANAGLQITSSSDTGSSYINLGDPSSANDGQVYYNHTDRYLRFIAGDTEKLRILPTGGITFNGDTAAANALDDYEEGTWTPANQWITLTNNATARYIKIGNQVTVWGNITWASSPGDVSQTGGRIQGLPFTAANSGDFTWHADWFQNASTGARKDISNYQFYLDNSTTLTIYNRPSQRVAQRQQVASTRMWFIATYGT